jgi:hypothetical protein
VLKIFLSTPYIILIEHTMWLADMTLTVQIHTSQQEQICFRASNHHAPPGPLAMGLQSPSVNRLRGHAPIGIPPSVVPEFVRDSMETSSWQSMQAIPGRSSRRIIGEL